MHLHVPNITKRTATAIISQHTRIIKNGLRVSFINKTIINYLFTIKFFNIPTRMQCTFPTSLPILTLLASGERGESRASPDATNSQSKQVLPFYIKIECMY